STKGACRFKRSISGSRQRAGLRNASRSWAQPRRGVSKERACRAGDAIYDPDFADVAQDPATARCVWIEHSDTAKILGVPNGTVKAQTARARAKLKLLMQNNVGRKRKRI